ncbi:sorbitol dehydrogenase family protein [Acidovorax sp. D4N7]|uniref:Sorbitol dehydrogenase family protein n=2 Tax=Comamonas endophytica TaxID=2949090 RepID=A0ABY6G8I0_9BURK|nr:sorbitol dehydrogenase family protein [Acidovorax sp. D4N7]MCD2514204.1 sorbitol dehydrogenase family protein [Acidovorax sp. D4N7]UYG51342.1 sorbitol dehydrogenase family protein [Acidovorax sp. 5MLIR]
MSSPDSLSRRQALLGAAAAVLTAYAGPLQTSALAGSGAAAPGALAPAAAAGTSSFMSLSQLLVNHGLNAAAGAKMEAYASQHFADFAGNSAAILQLAQERKATAVEDFYDDIPEGPQRELAQWIIFAWYSGMAGPGKKDAMFTYEHALTYQVTRDVVPIPSYGFTAPNAWQQLDNAPLLPIPQF